MIVVLFFIIIASMRVIQATCGKRASNEVESNKTFFLYGTYYQALAAVFSFITLCIMGFDDFNVATMICGLITSIFLMTQFYASLNAVKGCKIIVSSLFTYGGMIVCCIISWIWFGEKMSIFQGVGLAIFFASAYLISSQKQHSSKSETKRLSTKTFILLVIVLFAEGLVEVSQKYFSLKVASGNVAWYSFFMFLFSSVIMSVGFFTTKFRRALGGDNAPNYSVTHKTATDSTTVLDNNASETTSSVVSANETVATTDSTTVLDNNASETTSSVVSANETVATTDSTVASKQKKFKFLNKPLLICGALLAFAVFVINLLVTELGKTVSSAVLFPVSATISICITVIVGWLVYKEKLTVKNIIGVVLGLIAIIVLALFTPEFTAKLFN